MSKACGEGNIEALAAMALLVGRTHKTFWLGAFREACQNNQFEIAKLIYKYGLDVEDVPPQIRFRELFERDDTTEMIFWLIDVLSLDERSFAERYLTVAASKGNFELVKRICEMPKCNGKVSHSTVCEAIGLACVNEHFEIARWLKDLYKIKKWQVTRGYSDDGFDVVALCVARESVLGLRWLCEIFGIGPDDYGARELNPPRSAHEIKVAIDALLGERVAN